MHAGIAYLSNVAVLPSARRLGVACHLVAAAEALASTWGARSVGLHCNPNNTAAVQLYRWGSMGLEGLGVLIVLWVLLRGALQQPTIWVPHFPYAQCDASRLHTNICSAPFLKPSHTNIDPLPSPPLT